MPRRTVLIQPTSPPSLYRMPEVFSLREAELATGRRRGHAEELDPATALLVASLRGAVIRPLSRKQVSGELCETFLELSPHQ